MRNATLGTWDFSTNGTYWAGKAGIPSIGFGPGDEKTAHMRHENVPLDEVVRATEFYALFPQDQLKGTAQITCQYRKLKDEFNQNLYKEN